MATSKRVASAAGKLLPKKGGPKGAKESEGSALAQAKPKGKGK